MSISAQNIAIAGGGIGGLTTALALLQCGKNPVIYERSAKLSEIGAGLQLSANAIHVLDKLGLKRDILAAGFSPKNAILRDGINAAILLKAPLHTTHEARYGQPYIHIHRADLHAVLKNAVIAAGGTLHLGSPITDYHQDANSVAFTTPQGEQTADILIGADGIKSNIRQKMSSTNAPKFTGQFTGQTAWRGIVPASAMPEALISPDATVWTGAGRHMVTYYIRGGQLINFVAVLEAQDWAEQSWSVDGDIGALRNAFSGWARSVTTLLETCERCQYWGLFDLPPLPRWTHGRVALLGDAAHPMLPFMAQGAAMAIEDAYILARTLSAGEPLSAYEQARKAHTSFLQKISRENAQLYHAVGANRVLRNTKLALASKLPILRHFKFDPIYGINVTKD